MAKTSTTNQITKSNNHLEDNVVSINVGGYHINTDQELLIITFDKVELAANRYQKSVHSRRSWITPFTMLLTLITTLLSSSFKNWILKADQWFILFVFFAIIAFFWLLITIVQRLISPAPYRTLLEGLKNENKTETLE